MDVHELKKGETFLFDGRPMVYDDHEIYHGACIVRMVTPEGVYVEPRLADAAEFARRAAPAPTEPRGPDGRFRKVGA